MKIHLYSVRDIKAQTFLQPTPIVNNDVAIRSFGFAINDVNTDYGKHPNDYDLFLVANFETETGQVHSYEPQLITTGMQLYKPQQITTEPKLRGVS